MRKPLRLYRVATIAQSLGMSQRTINRHLADMGVEPAKMGAQSVRFINDIQVDALKAHIANPAKAEKRAAFRRS